MKKPEKKPRIRLAGRDGNAYSILGRVSHALRKAGADEEYVEEYHREAISGDYNNLLTVTMKYVDVE